MIRAGNIKWLVLCAIVLTFHLAVFVASLLEGDSEWIVEVLPGLIIFGILFYILLFEDEEDQSSKAP